MWEACDLLAKKLKKPAGINGLRETTVGGHFTCWRRRAISKTSGCLPSAEYSPSAAAAVIPASRTTSKSIRFCLPCRDPLPHPELLLLPPRGTTHRIHRPGRRRCLVCHPAVQGMSAMSPAHVRISFPPSLWSQEPRRGTPREPWNRWTEIRHPHTKRCLWKVARRKDEQTSGDDYRNTGTESKVADSQQGRPALRTTRQT